MLPSTSPEITRAPAAPATPVISRNAMIAGGVLVFHVAALWALQTGLLRRAIEVVVPAEILSQLIEPPQPKVEPPAPAPAPPVPRPLKFEPPPPPMPVAIADPTPAPNAPVGVVAAPAPLPPIAAPVSPAAPPVVAAPPPPAPPAVQLPSSDADYLQNPPPAYPSLSKRMGEQGKVMVRVFIGTDGNPQKAEITRSSGFDRLDQAAVNTVMKWRYVAGKRNGVAEPMWANVPINFVLE